MSEGALLEEDIWEYKLIRKQKSQSNSDSTSASLQTVNKGKCRSKGRGNGNKKGSVEKNGTPQKSKQRLRPSEDVDPSKDDSRVQAQESVSSLTEQGSPSTKLAHDGYCPSCQMPFSLLLVQTPRWHVAECLDTPGSVEKECPDGLLCTSTIPSHYKRYSHFLLAASRAGEYLANSAANTLERKTTCCTAAKSSCFPSHAEGISQTEKPSENFYVPNNQCTSTIQDSEQRKSQNITGESTSSFADVQKPQQIFQLAQTADNSCKFEFYDFTSSQESVSGEDLCSQKGESQLSLLQSKADFSDCEISYSPLSTCEESEGEAEEEKGVKTLQNKLLSVQNFEGEESNSEVVVFKKQHSEEINTSSYPHHSGKTASHSHIDSKCCNSPRVDNQQEAVSADSSSPLNCNEEFHQPGLISPAVHRDNKKSQDGGTCALDSVFSGLTHTQSELFTEGAGSPLSQKNKALRGLSTVLTGTDKMTADAIENGAFQESLQPVVKEEENLDAARVCFPSPISKTASSRSLASMNAKSSPAKELKQMDIGVFFGLKPKVKEESKGEACLGEGKPTPSSVSPSGKRSRQRKRKAEGSVEDVEAIKESLNKDEDLGNVTSGGQRKWRKRFKESSTTGEGTRKKQCPFYKKIPGTGFTVDAFQYGEIEGCTAYFLTHFHSDHYCGLTKNFVFPLYCNKITGNLVKSKLRVKEQYIHVLPMDTECIVNGIKVVLLDANHCPGAAMILFYLPSGTAILHTGDFRADPSMERYPALIGQKIHTLYLDTTYCSPEYTFPPQQEVIQFAVNTAFEMVTLNPRTLVVCGTYSIGKEKVFLGM
ncbi:UNVERIFIED_CONTAM: hypothetical protein H355_009272 [Colinus virginianus]|nr:hypothetical protein H355_009272 [Colinus virginianus]